jgi:hypothetical protein
MASDFPPGFLLVGVIAASSALIFWLLPPECRARRWRTGCRRTPVRPINGWDNWDVQTVMPGLQHWLATDQSDPLMPPI